MKVVLFLRGPAVAILLAGACSAPSVDRVPAPGSAARPPQAATGSPAASIAERTPRPGRLLQEHERRIDAAVTAGMKQGDFPGAVVLVQRDGHTLFRRAYGARAVLPSRLAMAPTTVFDLASLTKPVATATAIMILRDRGKLALDDRVAEHLPGCGLKASISELLTHRSGLPAANALRDYRSGRAAATKAICDGAPGPKRERYSDLGYILLGEIVARVSGKPFATFCHEEIFGPLGMKDTGFSPGAATRARAASTEKRDGTFLQGYVHDPRAAALGGVAGHAGLFSTAGDLARWADMLMGEGARDGVRVLSVASARAMLAALEGSKRTLALVRSVVGGVGHTGFTGTSLWLDPERHTALVILASRLHPDGEGTVTTLRQALRAVVLDANSEQRVRLGIDVARAEAFTALAGKRVGLITNATGRARDGVRTADLLQAAPNVELKALFSPEHGIGATAEGAVGNARDAATGLPVFSLYGENKRPTKQQLRGIDTLVFDVQSIGARFYTYVTTLGYSLESASQHGVALVVLDRPNPIGGVIVEGPVLEAGRESFVGYHRIPVRHGMTLGELARLFNAERKIGAELSVVAVDGWRRGQDYGVTGLPWTDPSPNIRSPEAALLYPGLALLEMTNVSVGRGTDAPFVRIGAPWFKASAISAELHTAKVKGVTFAAETFTPTSSRYAGVTCEGLRFSVTNAPELRSVRLGVALAVALRRHHRRQWKTAALSTLIGHQPTVAAILAGKGVDEIVSSWKADLVTFEKTRARYLLYP